MKSSQFVCKETSATSNLDAIAVPAPRFSDSYPHSDRENVFQRFGSFMDNKETMLKSGLNEKELCEVAGLMSPGTSSKAPKVCLNLPKVDFSTFMPLLGTKFFCFHPSNFALVSEEIVSYLNFSSANINYDLDEANHVWKCQENVDFESATFTIALFEDSVKDKIFVKFHRLSGSPSVFSSSVERFCTMACLSSELKSVNPTDLSETRVTSLSIKESSKKKRGTFKALPLPLNMQHKSITCPEFIAYCEIFNLWSHSDIPECLASLLSSMPKMWKDLMAFYVTVEKNPSSESMADLVAMFASINRIYKNLCAIAVQSHNSMSSGVSSGASNQALTSLNLDYHCSSPSHPVVRLPDPYDYLDYDEVDTTAGYADDVMYGAHAAASNYAHRNTVTMDVTRSHFRSMRIFEEQEQNNELKFTQLQVDTSKNGSSATVAPVATIEINLSVKGKAPSNNDSLYSKFLHSPAVTGSITGDSTPEAYQFADMLSNQSKEDLSNILYLSMACICQQFTCQAAEQTQTENEEIHSFDMQHYLTRLLKSNQEFFSVLQEMSAENILPPVNSLGSYRSKDIKLCANQLVSILN